MRCGIGRVSAADLPIQVWLTLDVCSLFNALVYWVFQDWIKRPQSDRMQWSDSLERPIKRTISQVDCRRLPWCCKLTLRGSRCDPWHLSPGRLVDWHRHGRVVVRQRWAGRVTNMNTTCWHRNDWVPRLSVWRKCYRILRQSNKCLSFVTLAKNIDNNITSIHRHADICNDENWEHAF